MQHLGFAKTNQLKVRSDPTMQLLYLRKLNRLNINLNQSTQGKKAHNATPYFAKNKLT